MLAAENENLKAFNQKTVTQLAEKHTKELENESKYTHYICLYSTWTQNLGFKVQFKF